MEPFSCGVPIPNQLRGERKASALQQVVDFKLPDPTWDLANFLWEPAEGKHIAGGREGGAILL